MTLIDGAHRSTSHDTLPTRVVTTRLATRLRGYLERDGGFTVAVPSGLPVSGGVSVCADPELTLRFHATEWDTSRVARWLQQWEHRIVAEAMHLGGWLDPRTDHVVLDVVVVFPDHERDRAVEHGRHLAQRAAFDLTNDQLIPLHRDARSAAPDRTAPR